MYISREKEQAYAAARQEKQQIFQENWNRFLEMPGLRAALLIYGFSQAMLLLLSGLFVYDMAIYIGILQEGYPFWCNFAILAVQLLISAPGALSCAALFYMRKKGAWKGEQNSVPGFPILRKANLAVSIVGGIALGLYPTIIITAGEYLPQDAIERVFYLFLAMTGIFIISIVLIRPVLRRLEENVSCCRADAAFVLPLMLVMAAIIVAVLLFAPLTKPFYLCVVLTVLSLELLLFLYWRFLARIAEEQEKIDSGFLSQWEDQDDPYNRY